MKFAAFLTEAKAGSDEAIAKIRAQWDAEQAFYQSRLAFLESSDYWVSQRRAHIVACSLWAVVAASLVATTAMWFIPESVHLLEQLRFNAAAATLIAKGASILTIGLPEFVRVGVVAFLLLWGLRFSARQVAQGLHRLEDATLRKTMLDTYLALTYPRDGKPSTGRRHGPGNHHSSALPSERCRWRGRRSAVALDRGRAGKVQEAQRLALAHQQSGYAIERAGRAMLPFASACWSHIPRLAAISAPETAGNTARLELLATHLSHCSPTLCVRHGMPPTPQLPRR
jgi:hypothetical protein